MNNIIKKFEKMNDEQLDQLFKSLDERTDIIGHTLRVGLMEMVL
jgi:hypothetical protein